MGLRIQDSIEESTYDLDEANAKFNKAFKDFKREKFWLDLFFAIIWAALWYNIGKLT